MTTQLSLRKLLAIYHEHKKFFLTFLMTGGMTALIYFSVFALLWNVLHLNHIIAVSAGYLSGTTFHFFANKTFTFKAKDPQVLLPMFKYLILILINYIITLIIVQITLLFIPSPYVGILFSTGATVITGYLLFKYWIFKNTAHIQTGELS